MTGRGFPGLNRRAWGRASAAVAIGAVGELAAIAMLATGAWLLLTASLRLPILQLSIAIGAVQLFSLGRGFSRYGERLASHSLGLGLQARLRSRLYCRLARLLPAGLPGGDRGDLLSRLISDTEGAQDLVVRAAVPVLAAVISLCAGVGVTTVLLPTAGGFLLAAAVSGLMGVAVAVTLAGRKAASLPAARGAVGAWAIGTLISAEELIALGAGAWAAAELAERERVVGERTRAVAASAGLGRAASSLAGGLGLAGAAWACASALRGGRIGPVELGVLVFLALGVAGVLQGLPDALSSLPVAGVSLRRLADLDRISSTVTDVPAGYPEPGRLPQLANGAMAGHARCLRTVPVVALHGAAAGYPDRPGLRPAVFTGVDLELAPGRPAALAGPSGCGKTSVIFALLRFIDLTAGHLTFDGTDARALPPEAVRALLAWSPEQPPVFPVSLRANLRLGAPHATDGQIVDLLRRFGLGPWLDQLERGLDTVMAPWGHPVSAGELQRLSVARAILSERPVLLLDEPTSHLDAATAGAVLSTVLEYAERRSLLWVTHRPDELAQFPEVVWMAGAQD